MEVPILPSSLLSAMSFASRRKCKACCAISSLARFEVIMKIAPLHSMVFPFPSVRRPCQESDHRTHSTSIKTYIHTAKLTKKLNKSYEFHIRAVFMYGISKYPNNQMIWRIHLVFFTNQNVSGKFLINLLTPNDDYIGRTAPLTSKRCILYIYSTNIGTEYFKHGI